MEKTLIAIVGGQAAIVVGHIVFDWLKNGRNQKNKTSDKEPHCSLNRAGTISKINWLHETHSKTDDDGRLRIYFPGSIEPNIAKMVGLLEDIKRGLNGK